MSELLDHAPWQRERFSIFGKDVQAPRLTAWYGDTGVSYRYTGIDHIGHGWPGLLEGVRQRVAELVGYRPNFVVVNRYDHGAEHMGWHKDDEQGLDAVIASLSLGETRRFRIQQPGSDKPANIDLGEGSLLIFDGRWRHQLAKTSRPCETRINLTFRKVA